MATFKTLEEIDAWKKARELTKKNLRRISVSRIRFVKLQFQSCPISLKDMIVAELENLYSSWP